MGGAGPAGLPDGGACQGEWGVSECAYQVCGGWEKPPLGGGSSEGGVALCWCGTPAWWFGKLLLLLLLLLLLCACVTLFAGHCSKVIALRAAAMHTL